ncbi:BadF/BadG/BcrA/BcrD ATPase family protein [Nocardioides sp. NPDC006273]|uniref:N-acetylglucosamine kinase n=1 Tax=Nocardioides sp. NPDC006273 TaxID=3155598 RepID=UPI0033B62EB0
MTHNYLGLDAGGTSTRAVVVSSDGRCGGIGKAGSGNPTSAGIDAATSAIRAAVTQAMAAAGVDQVSGAALAVAGAGGAGHRATIAATLSDLVANEPVFDFDVLAAYFSGTAAPDGYVLLSGTGASAVRVENGRLAAISDGLGWLLGDVGSGFWLGREAVRAGLAPLDGRGATTLLTSLLLERLGTPPVTHREGGRTGTLVAATAALYAMPPLRLADFAALVFTAADADDEVAAGILDRAAAGLAETLVAVRTPDVVGPLVAAGSVLARQPDFAARVAPGAVVANDGLAGAAVLALRHAGVLVDDDVYRRVTSSLAQLTEV